MLDVAPVLDPARRAFESVTSGTKRDTRAAAREALEASRELRRAAHEMRRAVERFPRSSARLPAASVALSDAARAVRVASKASREAGRDGIGSAAVLEAIRADLDIAAGAASDAAALGLRALAPLSARIGESLADMPETVRSTGLAATSAATAAKDNASKAAANASKAAAHASKAASEASRKMSKTASKTASRAGKASKKARRLDFGSVVDVGSLADLAEVAVPAAHLIASARPSMKTRRRSGPSLVQLVLFVVVPIVLVAPLVMLIARRRGSLMAEEHDTWAAGGATATAEVDQAMADDLLRSEGEGFSTAVGAPTMGAAAAGGGPREESAEPKVGEPLPATVVVADATNPDGAEGRTDEAG